VSFSESGVMCVLYRQTCGQSWSGRCGWAAVLSALSHEVIFVESVVLWSPGKVNQG